MFFRKSKEEVINEAMRRTELYAKENYGVDIKGEWLIDDRDSIVISFFLKDIAKTAQKILGTPNFIIDTKVLLNVFGQYCAKGLDENGFFENGINLEISYVSNFPKKTNKAPESDSQNPADMKDILDVLQDYYEIIFPDLKATDLFAREKELFVKGLLSFILENDEAKICPDLLESNRVNTFSRFYKALKLYAEETAAGENKLMFYVKRLCNEYPKSLTNRYLAPIIVLESENKTAFKSIWIQTSMAVHDLLLMAKI